MVKVYQKQTKEIEEDIETPYFGEIIKEDTKSFTLHSWSAPFSKKEYYYKVEL
ncbi:hypothetical protein [Aquimarina mytili]|uniref:Uncharacterized protein n=1 Tax=Aquimarina mytili TaxID=874423 RepID=A0A937A745_9FLAO|nr:hypothetical protein [Aquimarina mytili]MBL0686090.1 hypothetical protein [Aquimarina mytili]